LLTIDQQRKPRPWGTMRSTKTVVRPVGRYLPHWLLWPGFLVSHALMAGYLRKITDHRSAATGMRKLFGKQGLVCDSRLCMQVLLLVVGVCMKSLPVYHVKCLF